MKNGRFDAQKVKNPEISGVEYQQGSLYGYMNNKYYLLDEQCGKCALCDKPYDMNQPWNTHHLVKKSLGGSDNHDNLVVLHRNCHHDIVHGKDEEYYMNLLIKKKKNFKGHSNGKGMAFMNIIRNRIRNEVNADITYGYITSVKRIEQGLGKTHYNDAFVIANGDVKQHVRTEPIIIAQGRRNNRCLCTNNFSKKDEKKEKDRNERKKKLERLIKSGKDTSLAILAKKEKWSDDARRLRLKRHPYQKYDKIKVNGKWEICGGVMNGGDYVYYGKPYVDPKTNKNRRKYISSKKIEGHISNGSLIWACTPKEQEMFGK